MSSAKSSNGNKRTNVTVKRKCQNLALGSSSNVKTPPRKTDLSRRAKRIKSMKLRLSFGIGDNEKDPFESSDEDEVRPPKPHMPNTFASVPTERTKKFLIRRRCWKLTSPDVDPYSRYRQRRDGTWVYHPERMKYFQNAYKESPAYKDLKAKRFNTSFWSIKNRPSGGPVFGTGGTEAGHWDIKDFVGVPRPAELKIRYVSDQPPGEKYKDVFVNNPLIPSVPPLLTPKQRSKMKKGRKAKPKFRPSSDDDLDNEIFYPVWCKELTPGDESANNSVDEQNPFKNNALDLMPHSSSNNDEDQELVGPKKSREYCKNKSVIKSQKVGSQVKKKMNKRNQNVTKKAQVLFGEQVGKNVTEKCQSMKKKTQEVKKKVNGKNQNVTEKAQVLVDQKLRKKGYQKNRSIAQEVVNKQGGNRVITQRSHKVVDQQVKQQVKQTKK